MSSDNWTLASSPEFFGRALFCEDVRLEASGQITIVGATFGTISVPSFPANLPKLGVLIDIQMRSDAAEMPIMTKGFLPGASAAEPYFEGQFIPGDGNGVQPQVPDFPSPFPAPSMRRLVQVVVSQNLVVQTAGLITIRAFRDDLVYALGAISVQLDPAIVGETTASSA